MDDRQRVSSCQIRLFGRHSRLPRRNRTTELPFVTNIIIQEFDSDKKLCRLVHQRASVSHNSNRREIVFDDCNSDIVAIDRLSADKTNAVSTDVSRHGPLWIPDWRKIGVQFLKRQQCTPFTPCPSSSVSKGDRTKTVTNGVIQFGQHCRPFQRRRWTLW